MRRSIKTILMILIAVIIIYIIKVVFTSIFIGGGFIIPLNYEKAEKKFESRKEEFYLVSKYFSELEYDSIYIPNTMKTGIMSVGGNEVNIENDEVIQAITKLKISGINVIGKEDNSIHFQIWSNLDSGRGVVFSIDGTEPTLQFLTKLEKLSEENWYYYEDDYNEWRLKK